MGTISQSSYSSVAYGAVIAIGACICSRTSALHDRSVEGDFVCPTVCRQLQAHISCSVALAEDADIVRITSECGNVIFHPKDAEPLVFETGIQISLFP